MLGDYVLKQKATLGEDMNASIVISQIACFKASERLLVQFNRFHETSRPMDQLEMTQCSPLLPGTLNDSDWVSEVEGYAVELLNIYLC